MSPLFTALDATLIAADIERAFTEDLGQGDATAELLPIDAHARAELTCRDSAVHWSVLNAPR
jgi:nicotinate-nucleotide pyrophosphorylase (carboxylating)